MLCEQSFLFNVFKQEEGRLLSNSVLLKESYGNAVQHGYIRGAFVVQV